jgi:hypothetical protein
VGALSIEDRHVGTIEAIAPKLDTTEAEAKTDGLPMDKLEGYPAHRSFFSPEWWARP